MNKSEIMSLVERLKRHKDHYFSYIKTINKLSKCKPQRDLVISALIDAWEDIPLDNRVRASEIFGALNAKEAVPLIVSEIKFQESYHYVDVCKYVSLLERLDPSSLESIVHNIVEMAISSRFTAYDPFVIGRVINALKNSRSKDAVDGLIKLSECCSPSMLAGIILHLHRKKARHAVPFILDKFINAKAPIVKKRAATALGNLQAKEAIPYLLEGLAAAKNNASVSRAISFALKKLGIPEEEQTLASF